MGGKKKRGQQKKSARDSNPNSKRDSIVENEKSSDPAVDDANTEASKQQQFSTISSNEKEGGDNSQVSESGRSPTILPQIPFLSFMSCNNNFSHPFILHLIENWGIESDGGSPNRGGISRQGHWQQCTQEDRLDSQPRRVHGRIGDHNKAGTTGRRRQPYGFQLATEEEAGARSGYWQPAPQ